MPKSKLPCPHCSKNIDTGHLTEHLRSCQKQKSTCKKCGKKVARLRSHQCPQPKPTPHPQLSAYFNIDEHDWRSRCPLAFDHGINAISSLDDSTISQWDGRPPSLHLSKVQPSEETVYTLVISTIRQSSNYQVFRDGEVPPELCNHGRAQLRRSTKSELDEKKFRMAATALYQAVTTAPRNTAYSILNVWPTDTSEILMQPPQQLQSSLHLCMESFDIGINVTPKGSFVDLHHDITRRGLSKTIGKCKKIWLLFPSTPANLELYIASAGFSNRLARIGSKLRGGIIVETDSAHELEFPAGTLHAVFTTVGGFLAGINYSTAECLPTMSRVLKAHLPIFHISPAHISEDIQAYIETLSSTLQMELPSVLFDSLQSWVDIQPAIQELLDSGQATSLFRVQVQALNKCLDIFGRGSRSAFRCGCGEYVDNIGNHVTSLHKILRAS